MAEKPEQDVAQLETLLRQLEREYDQFFCGQLRREPWATENALLTLVRSYATRPLQNNALAFKYGALVARYNAFRVVWSRRLREKEEGRSPGTGLTRPAAPPPAAGRTPQRAHNASEYLAVHPEHETRRMQELYETYRRLREEAGEPTAKLRVENFRNALVEKIEKIKREQNCDTVLVRIVKDQGRARIVARPFRRAAGEEEAGS